MGNSDYVSFLKEIARFIPDNRIYTDDLRRLAWGTDAGFYRLIPKMVVRRYESVRTKYQRFSIGSCGKELGKLFRFLHRRPDYLATRAYRWKGK